MRILITGGAGFIGSHLAEHFHKRAHVRVLDNFRTGVRHNLTGLDVELIEGSILDRAQVAQAINGADYVFHLAAMVSVPESVERPQDCAETNVIGLLNVLEASAKAGVRKLCFSSSSAVYGDNPSVPKYETMQPEPKSPYAVTKLDGEFYCRQYAEGRGLETVSLRFFNVFGPRQNPFGSYAAAVPLFIHQALSGKDLTIFGDGGQTRDFIYVKDIVAANAFAATAPGLTGVFNVGCGGRLSILELARRIIELSGSSSKIVHAPERPGDVRHSQANTDRFRMAGFRTVSSLDEGLSETVAQFRASAGASRDA